MAVKPPSEQALGPPISEIKASLPPPPIPDWAWNVFRRLLEEIEASEEAEELRELES